MTDEDDQTRARRDREQAEAERQRAAHEREAAESERRRAERERERAEQERLIRESAHDLPGNPTTGYEPDPTQTQGDED